MDSRSPSSSRRRRLAAAENLAASTRRKPRPPRHTRSRRRGGVGVGAALVERGSFATDGRRIAGHLYRDSDAFQHCYSVLHPLRPPPCAGRPSAGGRAADRNHGEKPDPRRTADHRRGDAARAAVRDFLFLAEGDAGHWSAHEGLAFRRPPRPPGFSLRPPAGPRPAPRCHRSAVSRRPRTRRRLRSSAAQPRPPPLNARGVLCTIARDCRWACCCPRNT